MNIRWIRWIIVITIICTAVLVAGYRLVQPEVADVSAAPAAVASKNISLNMQATTVDEIEARGAQSIVQPKVMFEDDDYGYQISYPSGWEMLELSSDVVIFQSVDGVTRVKVEAIGPVAADGLAPFVDRSLYNDAVLSRQLLTIHGFAAERVIAFADSPGGQKTTFFIDADDTAYVITGMGQQSLIENIARSFNAPQVVALK
jgi:hypothetical protein